MSKERDVKNKRQSRQNLKRKLVQFAAFGFSNSQLGNLATGKLYQGSWKQFCNPGLNCYSCPAAKLSCPIGALQAVSGSMNFNFSFYVVGFLLAVGVLLGRFVCGWLCPFGLIQELIAKVPVKKVHLPKFLTYVKYVILVLFVIILPVAVTNVVGMGQPAFCEYICPAGMLEGSLPLLLAHPTLREALGVIFSLKMAIALGVLVMCMFVPRFFCKVLCPLGAIYGCCNKVSFYRLKVNETSCVSCGACSRTCPMDVDPVRTPDSAECIRCGKCAAACPTEAISLGVLVRQRRQ